ncbi:MAG TPA: monovalent cation/H+ antiporter complex subunit F [Acetobacteraceae bacterium]|nr:monovalent cation/H+ antiporter complex subunit F [Acetobacteraceae bacterium]
MAGLSLPWLAAGIGTILALVIPIGAALHGGVGERLVAVQMASVVTCWALAELSFAFGQPSFLDLALTLGLLSVPGTLVFAIFMERWL